MAFRSKGYFTRAELWKSLPKRDGLSNVQANHGLSGSIDEIIHKDEKFVWAEVDNPKLKDSFKRSVRLR